MTGSLSCGTSHAAVSFVQYAAIDARYRARVAQLHDLVRTSTETIASVLGLLEGAQAALVRRRGGASEDAASIGDCCALCFVYLGDLARYSAEHPLADAPVPVDPHSGASELWVNATACYVRAALLEPGGGHAHNQLAVVARLAGSTVACAYRFMRADAATKSPFRGIREELAVVYELNRGVVERFSADPLCGALSKVGTGPLAQDAVLLRAGDTAATTANGGSSGVVSGRRGRAGTARGGAAKDAALYRRDALESHGRAALDGAPIMVRSTPASAAAGVTGRVAAPSPGAVLADPSLAASITACLSPSSSAPSPVPVRRAMLLWTLERVLRCAGMVSLGTDLDKLPRIVREISVDTSRLLEAQRGMAAAPAPGGNVAPAALLSSSSGGGLSLDGVLLPPHLFPCGWLLRCEAMLMYAYADTAFCSPGYTRTDADIKRAAVREAYAVLALFMFATSVIKTARRVLPRVGATPPAAAPFSHTAAASASGASLSSARRGQAAPLSSDEDGGGGDSGSGSGEDSDMTEEVYWGGDEEEEDEEGGSGSGGGGASGSGSGGRRSGEHRAAASTSELGTSSSSGGPTLLSLSVGKNSAHPSTAAAADALHHPRRLPVVASSPALALHFSSLMCAVSLFCDWLGAHSDVIEGTVDVHVGAAAAAAKAKGVVGGHQHRRAAAFKTNPQPSRQRGRGAAATAAHSLSSGFNDASVLDAASVTGGQPEVLISFARRNVLDALAALGNQLLALQAEMSHTSGAATAAACALYSSAAAAAAAPALDPSLPRLPEEAEFNGFAPLGVSFPPVPSESNEALEDVLCEGEACSWSARPDRWDVADTPAAAAAPARSSSSSGGGGGEWATLIGRAAGDALARRISKVLSRVSRLAATPACALRSSGAGAQQQPLRFFVGAERRPATGGAGALAGSAAAEATAARRGKPGPSSGAPALSSVRVLVRPATGAPPAAVAALLQTATTSALAAVAATAPAPGVAAIGVAAEKRSRVQPAAKGAQPLQQQQQLTTGPHPSLSDVASSQRTDVGGLVQQSNGRRPPGLPFPASASAAASAASPSSHTSRVSASASAAHSRLHSAVHSGGASDVPAAPLAVSAVAAAAAVASTSASAAVAVAAAAMDSDDLLPGEYIVPLGGGQHHAHSRSGTLSHPPLEQQQQHQQQHSHSSFDLFGASASRSSLVFQQQHASPPNGESSGSRTQSTSFRVNDAGFASTIERTLDAASAAAPAGVTVDSLSAGSTSSSAAAASAAASAGPWRHLLSRNDRAVSALRAQEQDMLYVDDELEGGGGPPRRTVDDNEDDGDNSLYRPLSDDEGEGAGVSNGGNTGNDALLPSYVNAIGDDNDAAAAVAAASVHASSSRVNNMNTSPSRMNISTASADISMGEVLMPPVVRRDGVVVPMFSPLFRPENARPLIDAEAAVDAATAVFVLDNNPQQQQQQQQLGALGLPLSRSAAVIRRAVVGSIAAVAAGSALL